MYVYCDSSGEYEHYFEIYYLHENQYTDEEFEEMVLKASKISDVMFGYYPNEDDLPDLLCILYGFKEMVIQASFYQR